MFENTILENRKRELMAEQLEQHRTQQRSAGKLLNLAMLITFLLYLAFNVHLYLGDPTTWAHYFNDGYAAGGFIFMVGLAVLMAAFLSWVKHLAYLHFGLYGSVTLIVFTVIGFALFAEFFSSSATQDAKSNINLQSNQAYQQTLQTGASSTPAPVLNMGGNLATQVADARQRLTRCEENQRRGKEKHCKGDESKLKALQESQQATMQAQTTAIIATAQAQAQADTERMKLQHARQDKLKADSYNPVIVMVAQLFSVFTGNDYTQHIKAAVVMVMLIVAVCFEILHHFLSDAKARADSAVMGVDLEVAKLEGLRMDNPEHTTTQTTTKQPFGFNLPEKTAQPALFQYQRAQPKQGGFMGFIDTNQQPKAERPRAQPAGNGTGTGKHSPILGTAEVQLPLPELSTWNRELSEHGIDSPSDPVMNRTADKASIQRIIAGAQQAAKPCVDRAHTVSGSEPEKPCVDRAHTVGKGETESLYPAWVADVKAKQCRPSVRDTRTWLQKRIAPTMTGTKTHDLKRIDQMTRAFFSRAIRDGLAQENPNYINGGKKYLWIGA